MWDLPESGTEPVFPALGGRFFTSEQPEKFTTVCTILGINGDYCLSQETTAICQSIPQPAVESTAHSSVPLLLPAPAFHHKLPPGVSYHKHYDRHFQLVMHNYDESLHWLHYQSILPSNIVARPATRNHETETFAVWCKVCSTLQKSHHLFRPLEYPK